MGTRTLGLCVKWFSQSPKVCLGSTEGWIDVVDILENSSFISTDIWNIDSADTVLLTIDERILDVGYGVDGAYVDVYADRAACAKRCNVQPAAMLKLEVV
ncbi:hypothetical protein FRB99_000363 [Tulasnella sp. 403]|nr:hypothetical protein FRB99_000363 [Tulasnella sp. 403]